MLSAARGTRTERPPVCPDAIRAPGAVMATSFQIFSQHFRIFGKVCAAMQEACTLTLSRAPQLPRLTQDTKHASRAGHDASQSDHGIRRAAVVCQVPERQRG